jgi:uncharacterized cupin superfamily protein
MMMRGIFSFFAHCSFARFIAGGSFATAAFQPLQAQPQRLHKHKIGGEKLTTTTTTALLVMGSSYLDSLQRGAVPPVPAATPTSTTPASQPPAASSTAPSSSQPAAQTITTSPRHHYHAPLDYFAVQHMKSKGPRVTKDWGAPQDATRSLEIHDEPPHDSLFFVGAWHCTPGGWPSPTPKAHTEIFFVLDGHGAIGDADGVQHYFGPGDTVIIPKGHTGRWDVWNSASTSAGSGTATTTTTTTGGIHKVWAVHEHFKIEEFVTTSCNPVIRTKVIHYHQLSPQYLTNGHDALYGDCSTSTGSASSQTYYNVGPTQVGVWSSSVSSSWSSFKVSRPYPKRTWFFMLEGVLFITDGATGTAHRCVPGDTVVIPQGWLGSIDVVGEGPVKKIWATAQVEQRP